MYLSGAILVSATVAGTLSSRVPVRLLIGPGLVIVGVSLLLIRGLNAGSTWAQLIPGMIVAGVGVGLVNPPLASYRWPLSAAGTSRAPRPAVRKVPRHEATRTSALDDLLVAAQPSVRPGAGHTRKRRRQ
jgi:hypothetical protein